MAAATLVSSASASTSTSTLAEEGIPQFNTETSDSETATSSTTDESRATEGVVNHSTGKKEIHKPRINDPLPTCCFRLHIAPRKPLPPAVGMPMRKWRKHCDLWVAKGMKEVQRLSGKKITHRGRKGWEIYWEFVKVPGGRWESILVREEVGVE